MNTPYSQNAGRVDKNWYSTRHQLNDDASSLEKAQSSSTASFSDHCIFSNELKF